MASIDELLQKIKEECVRRGLSHIPTTQSCSDLAPFVVDCLVEKLNSKVNPNDGADDGCVPVFSDAGDIVPPNGKEDESLDILESGDATKEKKAANRRICPKQIERDARKTGAR
ncbi:hypothetical protein Bhyg_08410 [Pseudolycoriella hygida]|uniref:Uncharacterized protein n=1 Tax=Pseudolycoriella hygida TaxID=35572 RepID=A0A9Q0N6D4_9DIPT|nr:hypothetical protein Bhyg_08410 [Pseudolycoriella hygida]